MYLNKTWLEWWIIIECAVNDAWNAFKNISFVCATVLVAMILANAVNLLFTLTLFIGVPVVYGLFWATMYRRAFDSGSLKISDFVDKENDPHGGNE